MYFVDKDLDDFVGNDIVDEADIYTTSSYSIENCVVTLEMLEVIWNEFFKLPSHDDRKQVALQKYSEEHERFVKSIRTLMGWTIRRKRLGQKVHLANVNLDANFSFNDEMRFTKRHGAFRRIRQQCGELSDKTEWAEVRQVCKELCLVNPKTYIRGKFELWFFVKFVVRLEQELRKAEDRYLRPKNTLTMSMTNAMDLLVARCAIFPRLAEFLKANLGS